MKLSDWKYKMIIHLEQPFANLTVIFDLANNLSPIRIYDKNSSNYVYYFSITERTRMYIYMLFTNYLHSKITIQPLTYDINNSYTQSSILTNKLSVQQNNIISKLLKKERGLFREKELNDIINYITLDNVTVICSDKQTGKSFIPLEMSAHTNFNTSNPALHDKLYLNSNIILVNECLIEQWKRKLCVFYNKSYKIIRRMSDLKNLLISCESSYTLSSSDMMIKDIYCLDCECKIIDSNKLKDEDIILISNEVFQPFMLYCKLSKFIFPRITIDSIYSLYVGFNKNHTKAFYNQLFINIYLMTNKREYLLSQIENTLYPPKFLLPYLKLIFNSYKNIATIERERGLLEKQQSNLEVSIDSTTDIDAIYDYQNKYNNASSSIINKTDTINKSIAVLDSVVIYNRNSCLTFKKVDTIIIKSNRYNNAFRYEDLSALLEHKEYKLIAKILNIKLLTYDLIKKDILFLKERYYTTDKLFRCRIDTDFNSNQMIVSSLQNIEKLKNTICLLYEEYSLNYRNNINMNENRNLLLVE